MKEKISHYLFQAAIGVLFGYFGILALTSPNDQATTWISPRISSMIEILIPVGVFMLIFGALQTVIAVLLIVNRYVKFALFLSAIFLVGIIINLGPNDVALRDLVIFFGVAHLYYHQGEKMDK